MADVAEKQQEIYSFITSEEENYRTQRVPLASNWRDWNMYEHIDRSFTLLNSRFYKGEQDYTRPFNNIILPIRAVNVRSEGFDVKDVQMYVDNKEKYHNSFFARKFHNWWAKENHIDEAIDESVESYFDYGLTLVKNVNEARPEVVPLQTIAFCDQTDILSGPICLKHNYSVAELVGMKGKWISSEIDKAITMSKFRKTNQLPTDDAETPGKYIEVYELHGMFPESWLGAEKLGDDWTDTGKYSPQIHIVTYYVSQTDGTKCGITLFKGKEPKPIFKALKRDPIHGRACGRGGIEELFHSQIWTNFSEMNILQMLEATSKVILTTNKKKVAQGNNFKSMKHGTILDLDGDGTLQQLPLQPINKTSFDNYVNKWEQVARTIGSASDPQLGLNPTSGTPLGTTEIVTAQGIGIHQYRQGKIAEFWAEIYRDWVIPHISEELKKGGRWLDTLSLDELQDVAEKVAEKEAFDFIKRIILKGKILTRDDVEQFKSIVMEDFMKKGEKRFIEILKGDFDNLPLDIEISIANKQANLAENVSKLNAVFRTVFTPAGMQVLQSDPAAGELLNNILESSGMSPIKFSALTAPKQMAQAMAGAGQLQVAG